MLRKIITYFVTHYLELLEIYCRATKQKKKIFILKKFFISGKWLLAEESKRKKKVCQRKTNTKTIYLYALSVSRSDTPGCGACEMRGCTYCDGISMWVGLRAMPVEYMASPIYFALCVSIKTFVNLCLQINSNSW